MKIMEDIIPINLSANQERSFEQATTCHICTDPFLGDLDAKWYKVRITLRREITGKYRDAVHNSCNNLAGIVFIII